MKREQTPQPVVVFAQLNARVQPLDRGEYFEDPLDEVLRFSGVGEVTGGGTQMTSEPDGIEWCDIEITLIKFSQEVISLIISELEKLGAPKGSFLRMPDIENNIEFGLLEGMAIFLNGVDLAPEVYRESDVNMLIKRFEAKIEGFGRFRGYWEGSRETALYFYGDSFEEMKEATKELIASEPLCERARLVQIA